MTIELEAQLPARPRQRRRVSRTDGHRQSARGDPLHRSRRQPEGLRAGGRAAAAGAEGDQAAPLRRRAGPAGGHAQGHQGADDRAVPGRTRFRGSARPWPGGSATAAKISTRANPKKIGRHEADVLYQAIQQTKIPAPATDCIAPIGEELILKGLHQVVPGEFYAAATRPPAVYRGNPFQIEVGLAYGGGSPAHRVSARAAGRAAGRERRPHAAAVPDHHLPGPGRRRGRQDPRRGRASARASRPAGSRRPTSTACTRPCRASTSAKARR